MFLSEGNKFKIYVFDEDLYWSDIITIVNLDNTIVKCSFDLSTIICNCECIAKEDFDPNYKNSLNLFYKSNWNSLITSFNSLKNNCKYFSNITYNSVWDRADDEIFQYNEELIPYGFDVFNINENTYKCILCLNTPSHPYFLVVKNDIKYIRLDGFTFDLFKLFYDNSDWIPTDDEYHNLYRFIQKKSDLWVDIYRSYDIGLSNRNLQNVYKNMIMGINSKIV